MRALNLEQILTFLSQHGITKVKLAAPDIDGILRGKYVSLDKFESAARKGFGFCDVVFGWDCQDVCYDFASVTGWQTGFPDLLAKVDVGTFRTIPWEPGTVCFLADFWKDPRTPLEVCPRNLLKGQIGRAHDMGYEPKASLEYEFWIFRETPYSLEQKGFRGLTPISPGSFGYSVLRASQNARLVHDLFDACTAMDVQLEGLHTETGPGVYEAAIAVQGALEAADRAVLFKQIVKEVCSRYDCVPTFMARWSSDQAGSGGHAHQSLWARDGGANVFSDPAGERGVSSLLKHYLGGLVEWMPDVTAMICPTINSYKRTVPGYWAPTSATWGWENRTTALRVISAGGGPGARIEYRLAGADANPYLVLAAGLACGLEGIRRELSPPAPTEGNAYESAASPLPRTLEEAAERLRASSAVREMLGSGFVDHFVASRMWEVREYRRAVTDWELRRYFEAI